MWLYYYCSSDCEAKVDCWTAGPECFNLIIYITMHAVVFIVEALFFVLFILIYRYTTNREMTKTFPNIFLLFFKSKTFCFRSPSLPRFFFIIYFFYYCLSQLFRNEDPNNNTVPIFFLSSCSLVASIRIDGQRCATKKKWLKVDLRHIDEVEGSNIVDIGMDLSEFYMSVEWDILEVPAVR